MKKVFIFIFLLVSVTFVSGQEFRTLCPFSASTFADPGGTGQGSYTWTVENRLTGQVLNGAVASITGATFGQRVSGAGSVSITFNSTEAARDLLTVRWKRETSNIFGKWTLRADGSFRVDVLLKQPTIEFFRFNADCSVTLRITNSSFQSGATYTWNNPSNTVDREAIYPFPVAASGVTATGCSQQRGATSTAPPSANSVRFVQPLEGFICASPGTTFDVIAANCFGLPNTWAWSASGPIAIINTVNSGDGRTSIVTISVGSAQFSGEQISLTASVQTNNGSRQNTTFGSLGLYPECEFLVRSDDGGGVAALKAITKDKQVNVTVYPNPANNTLNVANLSDAKEVQVYSILGQMVYNQPVEAQQTTLQMDVSKLGNGSYVVVIVKNDGQRETQKVQIQK